MSGDAQTYVFKSDYTTQIMNALRKGTGVEDFVDSTMVEHLDDVLETLRGESNEKPIDEVKDVG